jgi:predicted SnoaL-like aldol condensation-catalyzing enzyme
MAMNHLTNNISFLWMLRGRPPFRAAIDLKTDRRTTMTRLTIAVLALAAAPLFAALPVTPATDQAALLKSSDPKLARNKKNAWDFYRIVLRARHLDEAEKYMRVDYIQHNPNAETGIQGFKDYFTKLGPPKEIPPTVDGLVAIQAEGDYVTLSLVREYDEPKMKGKKYTSTWFDMFRFDKDGKIAEHWDPAQK